MSKQYLSKVYLLYVCVCVYLHVYTYAHLGGEICFILVFEIVSHYVALAGLELSM